MDAPKLYADAPLRRARQVLADLAVLLWVWLWLELARVVEEATLALGEPGREIERASSGLASRLRDAGAGVGDLPLVGDQVRRPLDGAGDAADQIAAAGASQASAVEGLAFWLMLVTAVLPVLLVLAVHLPLRWRFVRRATAARRWVESHRDLDLFAVRAMSHQPLHRLARVSEDPVGRWRAGDPDVVRRLAVLELRDAGLRPPPG